MPLRKITVDSLEQTSLTGTIETDSVGQKFNRFDLASGAEHFALLEPDEILSLAGRWDTTEFAIVGDCCGHTAKFSAGTSLSLRVTVHNGTTNAPECTLKGFTGEQNNLFLADTPTVGIQEAPTLLSNQSSDNTATPACAVAAGTGDIHISTFAPTTRGDMPPQSLRYDFQAEGDFVMARTESGFEVQARQISGAPTWPNASVNQAIAARIGHSVLIFSALRNTSKVLVDGKLVALEDGQTRSLSTDGDLTRKGNAYITRDMHGNSVHVVFQQAAMPYLDVYVGLGRWPAKVEGLLAHAGGNSAAVASRDGTVFPAPFNFKTFYEGYGNSWRVEKQESLFSAEGKHLPRKRVSNPKRPFDANDLKVATYQRAKKHCLEASVEKHALEDCILDVAVIGDKRAAKTHTHPRNPRWSGRALLLHEGRALPVPPERREIPGRH